MSSLGLSLLTLFAGFLLALMVFFNGMLAKHIHPIEASFIVHVVGLMASTCVMCLSDTPPSMPDAKPISRWPYITGVFGGIAVVCVGISVNSPIGVAGTVGLLVLGQVVYSWINDTLGLFGSPKRLLTGLDFLQAIFILAGVGVLIYG